MTSTSASFIVTAGVLFLVVVAVFGQREVEVHGDQTKQNGRTTQTLGGSVTDAPPSIFKRNTFFVKQTFGDGLVTCEYRIGTGESSEYRFLIEDGNRSVRNVKIKNDNELGKRRYFLPCWAASRLFTTSDEDQRNKFSVDGLRSGDYDRGHVEYGRQLLTNADGTKSLNGHVGLTRDNYGNKAKNFGLGYQDPKTSVNWDRQLSGPVRTDTYRAERNFYSSPDGRATLGGYLQHDRNNFGMRNTGGGIVGRYNFGR